MAYGNTDSRREKKVVYPTPGFYVAVRFGVNGLDFHYEEKIWQEDIAKHLNKNYVYENTNIALQNA